jgi:uncharacterized membrane protein YfcA
MKTGFPLRNLIIYAIMITIVILAGKTASAIIHRYEIIVNGILGLALIYLIYRVFMSSRSVEADEPITVWLDFPKNVRYFILGFFWSVILYWALDNIFRTILFLKR